MRYIKYAGKSRTKIIGDIEHKIKDLNIIILNKIDL